MPTYRYYTTDLLTGAFLGEFPLYGVFASKRLSAPGDFTGTFRLDTGDPVTNSLMFGSTPPGRTAIYMERNGVLIWGGILWSRTYATNGTYVQLTARTFESYFEHVVFEDHFIQQRVNQETIFVNMVNQLQARPEHDIDLVIHTPLPTTNTPRTILIPNYEFHFAREVVDQLITQDQGLEYTIEVNPNPGGSIDLPEKRLKLGFPLGTANDELYYEFPGSIANYWFPESGANGATKFATLGFGSGNKVARATAIDQDAIGAGYPGWWRVDNYSTIADLQIMQDKVIANAQMYKMPFKAPTFDMKADEGAGFTGWNKLGDTFKVRIQDARFPSGFEITSRMIGWDLTPASADNQEILKFAIDGSDA